MFQKALSSTPVLIAILAVLYWVSARAGMFMALPSGYSTIFWPASGFAVAFVYHYGYRLLPGVFIGCLALNLSTYYALADPDALHIWLLNGLGNATGATLQTYAGVWLVLKFVGSKSRLEYLRSILKFSILAGPVSCVISPSLGIGTLLVTGSLPADAVLFSWSTWYVGDTLGVLVFAPALVLLLNGQDISNRRKFMVIAPLMLLFALVVSLFFIARSWDERAQSERFVATTDLVFQQLQTQIGHHIHELEALKSLFHASDRVDPDEFSVFLKPIFERGSGTVAMGWIPRVPAAERSVFEAEELNGQYIKLRNEQGEFVPVGDMDEYYPVLYAVPLNKSGVAIGFNLTSEPTRKAALVRAWQMGEHAATAPVRLVSDKRDAEQRAFLIFNPIYTQHAVPETLEERQEKLNGLVVGVFSYKDILQPVIDLWTPQGIGLRVRDFDAQNNEVLVFDTLDQKAFFDPNLSISRMVNLNIGGRSWVLEFYKDPQYMLANVNWGIWGTLAGGLAFAFFASVFLLEVTGQTAVVENLVREKTKELRRSNKELQDFAYVASHDLKAPLRHVSLSVDFLKDRYTKKLDEQGLKLLKTMNESTTRMQDMIESLLSYSRVGQGEQDFKVVDLSSVLRLVCKSMEHEIKEKNVTIDWQGLPSVRGNENLLSRLFQNLIQNSIKYAKDNVAPVIQIEAQKTGEEWSISVTDNGIGIDPKYKDKVFGIFHRLHADNEYEGVGIGLSVCQRIIDVHGGKIWLDPEYRDGTRIVFILVSSD